MLSHALLWVRTNWISNEVDIRNAFHFAERAENLVKPGSVEPERRWLPKAFNEKNGGWQFLHAGVCQAQVLMTVIFALVAIFVIWLR
jgi:hypothetical protein